MKGKSKAGEVDMVAFQALYQSLNSAQKQAVDTIDGPVVVVAGPGTGKTQVLTLRIANIILQAPAGIGPENILALTFTTAAAATLRERLAKITGARFAHQVGIFTFHSFAEEQMRHYPEYFRQFFGGRPAGDLERIQIIEELVRKGDYKLLKTFASDTHLTKTILAAIDAVKQEGIMPEEFVKRIQEQEETVTKDENSYYKRNGKNYQKGDIKPDVLKGVEKNKELVRVYEGYQKELKEKKLYDYNDMLLYLIAALKEFPEFQALLMERYQYILVDEHQDTNGAQNQILELLTATPHNEPPNIFTVGDDKQAIYRFQGASLENFLHFAKRFANTVTIDLTQNYRSTQPILDVAHRLMENDTKSHVPLQSEAKTAHEQITVRVFENYHDELISIAADIREKIKAGVDPKEIAIFYRENKFLGGIQEALEKKGVPYVVSAKENILYDPVIRKLIWLLRAVANPLDNERLGEALMLDMNDVEPLDVILLFDEIRYGRKRKYLLQLMLKAEELPNLGLAAPEKLKVLGNFIQAQKMAGENTPFVEFFDNFIHESGFLKYVLKKPGAETHLRQLRALLEEVKKNAALKPAYRLSDFLQYIETILEYDVAISASPASAQKGVQLMTAHGSKGLEFEHVYITDVVGGRWNNKKRGRMFDLPLATERPDVNDERRLFYVALTRAKKNLTITYSKTNAEGKLQAPSIFLSEVAGEHLEEKSEEGGTEEAEAFFAPRSKFLPKLTDPEYIRERFFKLKLSATALKNYFTSPLMYFFCNLIRLPGAQTKTLLYGNVVHKALELFFREAKQDGALPPWERLRDLYQETLESEYLLREYYDDFLKRGLQSLETYYRERKESFTTNIETEKRIPGTFVLESGEEIMLTGILDKLEYLPDGTVRVVDYKTGRAWSEQTKEKKRALRRQIVFYKLLLDQYQEGGKSFVMTEGLLDFVEPNKKGKLEQERLTVTPDDVAELRKEINQFAKEVLSGEFLTKEVLVSKETKEYEDLLKVLQGE